jgi:iron complex outermembrane receptor protein
MNFRPNRIALAISCAFASLALPAQGQESAKTLSPVIVTADPFEAGESSIILAPARVLSGNELRNKLGASLGETLSSELGVSASGFSAGSSRPIIRGLEGPRVKILQNGMSTGDLSAISNDHAVSGSVGTARQVEILRGPAALLYGSGAIGGLVNIVNDRIPTALEPKPTGEAELRYSSVDYGKTASFSADASTGNIGLHADGSALSAGDYRIPGNSSVTGDGDQGRLSFSGNRERSFGFGSSLVKSWGYVGASVATLDKLYGVRGADEQSKIDLNQTRFDVDSLMRSPFTGFDALRIRLGNTDYKHVELEGGKDPSARFTNRSTETRWELSHLPLSGWRGKLGLHTEHNATEAANLEGGDPTVPRTRSQSMAAFLFEQKDFGDVRLNAGARLESVSRKPTTLPDRSFDLASWSAGALWSFIPGYGLGTTYSLSQRAPTAEELYSQGPHHPTETYDIGDRNLKKETSNNLELSLQKTTDQLRWKANLYQNKVQNFIYGAIGDINLDPEGELRDRSFRQADATLRGIEAELSYNLQNPGWYGRVFADSSRGKLDNLGNLPLQPTTRTGLNVGYQDKQWQSSLSVLHAFAHDRPASASISRETPTDSYTRVDANLSYVQRYANADLTWFVIARNLLNEEIRLSTSLLKDYVPQPGRSLIIGVRTRF